MTIVKKDWRKDITITSISITDVTDPLNPIPVEFPDVDYSSWVINPQHSNSTNPNRKPIIPKGQKL